MADAAHPAISTALLHPQDRIARLPLGAWAERLTGGLRELLRDTRQARVLPERLGAAGNNAALIAAHQGRLDQARALCEAQMRWQLRFSRRSRDDGVAALAIQPWVNLGRLDALSGEWKTALARFAALECYRAEGVMRLGVACVDGSGWAVVAGSPEEFARLLYNIHITDSLKALLVARRFEEAVEFCDGLERRGEWAGGGLVAEARVVALCRQGDTARARREADTAARDATGWARAVFVLRRAEVDACSGDWDRARPALRRIAAIALPLLPETLRELQTLYVTSRVAAACHEAGLGEEAHGVARCVYQGACAADDEVFRIEALRLLAQVAPAAERGEWEDTLARAEEHTEYRRYRRGGQPPPNPAIDDLFTRMRDVFAN